MLCHHRSYFKTLVLLNSLSQLHVRTHNSHLKTTSSTGRSNETRSSVLEKSSQFPVPVLAPPVPFARSLTTVSYPRSFMSYFQNSNTAYSSAKMLSSIFSYLPSPILPTEPPASLSFILITIANSILQLDKATSISLLSQNLQWILTFTKSKRQNHSNDLQAPISAGLNFSN